MIDVKMKLDILSMKVSMEFQNKPAEKIVFLCILKTLTEIHTEPS